MRYAASAQRIAGLALLTAASAVVAAAASVSITSSSLGAAALSVPRCTAAGLSVMQNIAAAAVASVTVSGLPAACGGATLQVTVNNGLATGSGSAAVPAGGGAVTVTMGVPPAVTGAEQTDIVLVGP
jgi:hypothetical protein